MSALLEVCVDNPRDLAAAIEGGAQRIELCSALDLGGLTPSPGLISAASSVPVAVYAMIRPRSGKFVFDAADEAAMMADIEAVRSSGLAGVVLGANRADNRLDTDMLARLLRHADGLGATLHRAFDLVPDFDTALDEALALGFERILTSGGAIKAVDGMATIERLAHRSSGKISIMPGSGVRPENVGTFLKIGGIREVHASCRVAVHDADGDRAAAFGFQAQNITHTDTSTVRRMRDAIAAFSHERSG